MMRFTQGNLLEANVEAIVNTVNTVGVMGKGIALMFKERYPENYRIYAAACKAGEIKTGKMLVTMSPELKGPRWIINFPTKEHWRGRTRIEWIASGLIDLRNVIVGNHITSIAIPPLGCGNGGLDWSRVRPLIHETLGELNHVDILVYEPTAAYQNVAKKTGVKKLTPARAMVAEMVRRYGVLGLDCSILEVQKLAWFLERLIETSGKENPLDLRFSANQYGPYANRLDHLLDKLDGSYLTSNKRIADSSPFDYIAFNRSQSRQLQEYLSHGEGGEYRDIIEQADRLIDGFQSPIGVEALATIDWLLAREGLEPTIAGVREGLARWPGGGSAGARKQKLFSDKLISLALERLRSLRLSA